MKRILYWLFTVSRGYSAPMSILNWFAAFVLTMKFEPSSNALYGLLCLIGIVFAHLGTNLFDDCIDYILKIPKQKCKTEYLENGFTSIKAVLGVTIFYFSIALLVGIFFYLKLGNPISWLMLSAGVMIILYPKLNNFALGELAVGLCFGVLLFAGINYTMSTTFNVNIILISIPISLLTIAVLFAHSLMDFDFDKKSGKYTVCQLLKTKDRALLGLMGIYFAAFGGTVWLILNHIMPKTAFFTVLLFPPVIKLYLKLKEYNSNPEPDKNDFKINFKIARNISLFYNLILVVIFLV